MTPLQVERSLAFSLSFLSLLSLLPGVVLAQNECQPSTWANAAAALRGGPTGVAQLVEPAAGPPLGSSNGTIAPGDINCRFLGRTYEDVNYYTCTELADLYGITVEQFFTLNPTVQTDCSNLLPNTEYCVAGCKCQGT
jgi:hypothetical protein